MGALSLAIYITSIQFFGFNDENYSFKEIIAVSLSLSSLIFILISVALVLKSNQNEHLKLESDINLKLLKSQENYYNMLLEKENETKAFRHDIQNHIYCMHLLLEKKEYKKLEEYFNDLGSNLKELKSNINTGNNLVDAIVSDISNKYKGVTLNWTGTIPNNVSISPTDLCIIFSNLLNNSFEAVMYIPEKTIEVSIKKLESNLLIIIRNHYYKVPEYIDGEYVSVKSEYGHGYGLKNVKRCVNKNKGVIEFDFEEGIFTTEIIFPKVLHS